MFTCLIRRRLVLLFVLGFLAAPFMAAMAQATDVTVFAAASLKNALDDAAKLYEAKTGEKVVVSYAASPALAKQIESGAPADIFFSADLERIISGESSLSLRRPAAMKIGLSLQIATWRFG
jgi:molybdate transport system substrate-binding protein